MMEKIDGISKELNTTFKTEDIQKNIQLFDDTLKEVAEVKINPDRLTLEDKKYLKEELMETIATMKHIKAFIEENIKPGYKNSDIEQYSLLCEKVITAIKELRVLNMDIVNTELAQRRLEQSMQIKTGNITNNIQNNTYMLDAKSLDKMIDEGMKNRRIDQVEIDFESDTQIK